MNKRLTLASSLSMKMMDTEPSLLSSWKSRQENQTLLLRSAFFLRDGSVPPFPLKLICFNFYEKYNIAIRRRQDLAGKT
jgi:hypothetical protein